MIKEIRDYIEAAIYNVDQDMLRHEQVFTDENISSTVINNHFFVSFGDFALNVQDQDFTANIPVSISIYKRLFNSVVENFDDGMCKAIDISSILANKKSIPQDGYIKAINSIFIRSTKIINDDTGARFTIELNVSVSFSTI